MQLPLARALEDDPKVVVEVFSYFKLRELIFLG